MEIMYIATMPNFKQNNVAGLMVGSAHRLGRLLCNGVNVKTLIDIGDQKVTNADAIPSIITAMATSVYTQKMGVKLGYDKVLEVNYDDYTIDGESFSKRIGDEHKGCCVIAKRLDL